MEDTLVKNYMTPDGVDLRTADFTGYASKANIKCSDGRTIRHDAFKHQDGEWMPLVWMHGHTDVENILGRAYLENRGMEHAEGAGLYTHAFFNDTVKGVAAKKLVHHKNITMMSIWAGDLIERDKQVFHGAVKEVSLVITGANKGARIDNVNIQHSDGSESPLDDEAVIFMGQNIELMHSAEDTTKVIPGEEKPAPEAVVEEIKHEESTSTDEKSAAEIYNSMSEEQKEVAHYMIGEAVDAALEGKTDEGVTHSETSTSEDANASKETAQHSDTTDAEAVHAAEATSEGDLVHNKEGSTNMSRNVFEKQGRTDTLKHSGNFDGPILAHSDVISIVEEAKKPGTTFKEAFLANEKVLAHAQEYGIENIDYLFPDAKTITSQPDVISRRTEWVAAVLDGAKHSPFSRVKSLHADLTADEARAKGYVKGNKKKDEVIKLLRRVTTPTTVYKKQKLDRDDMIDITDLDIVVWLKWEMRFMLEEELARAILIGDGRESDSDDKIDEEKLRPIAWDDDMYSHKVVVPSNTSPDALIESVLRARKHYKGTGRPTFFTTDDILTDMILLKDKVGRRLYNTEVELAAALRVSSIVVVEVMEDTPDILGIIVNMSDYVIGADRGGALTMFDDFDIDFNQQKYLIETRISGALQKAKSAVVLRRTSGTTVQPPAPGFNEETNTITIPTVSGVTYYDVTDIAGEEEVMAAGTHVITRTTDVEARANVGSTLPHNYDNDWTYAYTE